MIGAANAIEIASAIGIKLNPVMKQNVDPVIAPALARWFFQELTFSKEILFLIIKNEHSKTNIEIPRRAITWPTGYD